MTTLLEIMKVRNNERGTEKRWQQKCFTWHIDPTVLRTIEWELYNFNKKT